jgi:hypothetical protein
MIRESLSMNNSALLPEADVSNEMTKEVTELLRRIVAHSTLPLSAAQIAKSLPKSSRLRPEAVETLLEQEVSRGSLFAFPKIRNKAQYWIKPPLELARQFLLRKLQSATLTRTEALKAIAGKAFEDISRTSRDQIFADLHKEGIIHECPPFVGDRKSTRPKYSGHRPDPGDYIRDAIRKVAVTLSLPPEDVFKAAVDCASRELREIELDRSEMTVQAVAEPAQDLRQQASVQDERLLEAMRTINPRCDCGDMVDIVRLRKELDAHMPGVDFDQAVLDAVYRRRVAVHRYDRPELIPAAQRAQLLRDEQGQYYNTISLWRN